MTVPRALYLEGLEGSVVPVVLVVVVISMIPAILVSAVPVRKRSHTVIICCRVCTTCFFLTIIRLQCRVLGNQRRRLLERQLLERRLMERRQLERGRAQPRYLSYTGPLISTQKLELKVIISALDSEV